jgi:hypothetical protein
MRQRIAEELAFNFRAHGRVGRTDRTHLTPAQAQLVARTAGRTPEVMVKVLSGGATSAKAVRRHLEYVGRKGEWASPDIPDTEVKWDDDLGGVRWEGDISRQSSSTSRLGWSSSAA